MLARFTIGGVFARVANEPSQRQCPRTPGTRSRRNDSLSISLHALTHPELVWEPPALLVGGDTFGPYPEGGVLICVLVKRVRKLTLVEAAKRNHRWSEEARPLGRGLVEFQSSRRRRAQCGK